MAGKRDVSRLTVQIGKFPVHDVFDNNSYSMDPRADFLNWSIWAAGAFDYPADRIGRGKKNRKPLGAIAHRERYGQPFE